MKVAGRIAIVTGAARGIGAALAAELTRRGARVVLADLSPEVEATAAALGQPSWTGDASSVDGIASLLETARESLGEVDLYFANAGITGPPGLGTGDAEWDAILDVNLRAHIRAAQALVPGWQDAGEGHFVATASAAGLLTQIGSAAYSVTKHAAVGFAEWLNITYRDEGIRASVICPMGVNTDLLHGIGGTDDRPAGAVAETAPDEPATAEPASAEAATDESAVAAPTAAQRAVTSAGRVLEPDEVAKVALSAVEDDEFLILPHREVLDMYRMKASDYDRWLRGMSRYQRRLTDQGTTTTTPN